MEERERECPFQGALGLDETEIYEEEDEYESGFEEMKSEGEREQDPHSRKFKPEGQLMT